MLRAEILVSELDRERANNRQAIASATSALARQVHANPDMEFQTTAELPLSDVPAEIDRLYALAVAARPELKGRLAAVARDEKGIELAKKRAFPGYSLGVTYMDMEKTNAQSPQTASGQPNVGLFVAFNLPVHRAKYEAGVCEAKERAIADAKLYEAQRDETFGEIKDLMTQARVQRDVLALLRDQVLPRTRQNLENAGSEYANATSNTSYATLIAALREVLQVRLQIAQVEAELGKALASLERAVGCQINEHPPTIPPPPTTTSPFRPEPAPGDNRSASSTNR